LHRLEKIEINENLFTEIPPVLFPVRSLAYLDVSCKHRKGRIRQIPAQIVGLINLKTLDLSGQTIETPPPEIVQRGIEAVRNYWRMQHEQQAGIERLYEAKLLLIGEGGVGKSSLARKITGLNHDPRVSSTHGLNIHHWSFPTSLRVDSEGDQAKNPEEFRVNLWDFGGQEVYHATTQLFFTRRSVYLLVTDDRREDTDFDYWLQLVNLLSDGSPLLIVQNEKQGRFRDINLAGLRSRFSNIKGAYRINLKNNRGLDELMHAIQRELENLPHIGVSVPRAWKRVREMLERDPRDYVGIDQYMVICQLHGLNRREDALQLSGYLHDLGICMHFQEDPVLKNTLILNPAWGSEAVYRVLNDQGVVNRNGRFDLVDLDRVWSDKEYAPKRPELLRLMMKFQLCYELPGGQEYVSPQLLSVVKPEYAWPASGNTVVFYEYDFLPRGIVTRLIVALGHLIAKPNLVWRTGVVLDRDGTRAEITEDYLWRKITVRVAGPETRGLLAIVDESLERIHLSLPSLKYEKFLPCNCSVCRSGTTPNAYRLSVLKDFAKAGDSIQCPVSRKLIDAAGLIHDVLPESATRSDAIVFAAEGGRPNAPPVTRKEVFVSYAWTGESRAIVDQVQIALERSGVTLLRSENELQYKDMIRSFIRRIGPGKAIIVVLSRRYLQSANCMFELTEIAESGDIHDRVYPIVLGDANIYDVLGRLDYIKYWDEQMRDLDSKFKSIGENLSGIREEVDRMARIRSTIASIVDILSDMNAYVPNPQQESGLQELIESLEARLAT
jgi:GTPase SAR1 family protein